MRSTRPLRRTRMLFALAATVPFALGAGVTTASAANSASAGHAHSHPSSDIFRLRHQQAVQGKPFTVAASPSTSASADSKRRTSCGTSTATAVSRRVSEHFIVDFTAVPAGGLTQDDYVNALEEAYGGLVTRFGWAPTPPARSNPAPGGRYYVRVQDQPGLFGFVDIAGTHAGRAGDNPATPWTETTAYASCMALGNDFSRYGRLAADGARRLLRATAVHEYTHALQYGYGSARVGSKTEDANAWVMMAESTAVLMTEELVPEAEDGLRFLPPNLVDSVMPHTVFTDATSQEAYRMWFVLRGLVEPHGTGIAGGGEQIIQEFFESMSGGHGGARYLAALDGSLRRHGRSLGQAYHDFAIATWFLRSCDGIWKAPHCFRDAAAYAAKLGPRAPHATIAVGSTVTRQVEANYALQWLKVADAPGDLMVTVSTPAAGATVRTTVACTRAGAPIMLATQDAVAGRPVSVRRPAGACDAGTLVAVVTSASRTGDAPVADTVIPFTAKASPALGL